MAELVLVRDPWRNIWGPELSNVLVFHLFVFVCDFLIFSPAHLWSVHVAVNKPEILKPLWMSPENYWKNPDSHQR